MTIKPIVLKQEKILFGLHPSPHLQHWRHFQDSYLPPPAWICSSFQPQCSYKIVLIITRVYLFVRVSRNYGVVFGHVVGTSSSVIKFAPHTHTWTLATYDKVGGCILGQMRGTTCHMKICIFSQVDDAIVPNRLLWMALTFYLWNF